MKALVTGASSGIGREMAIYLSSLGFDLVLVSRSKEKLEKLASKLKTKVKLVVIDLASEKHAKDLYMITKNENIDLLVNNAGFGVFGDYNSVNLTKELEMIDLNVKAVHILTRMFLKDMVKKDKGAILNVGSSAGLLKGGPLMSTYYATKGYVVDFTLAIYEELRRNKSKVQIGVLCPGPVKTNFNSVAGVDFNLSSLEAEYVARYAIDKFLKDKKTIIVPGFKVRAGIFFSRFLSRKRLLKITYNIQRRKK
ncbi:MAG: SDR family NAD(P)-dependent oxidoreductase [Bacilli bacterium]|nr:SDR family NAD(P)-dependent oxidoreductase [Bacilli bacterium]